MNTELRNIHRRAASLLAGIAFAVAALLAAPAADAAPAATSDLLLPYFEVQLDGPGINTLFAVVNTSAEPVPVVLTAYSNYGIEVLQGKLLLPPHGVRSGNLRDWFAFGRLPEGLELSGDELAHAQAALCGEASPRDGLFHGGGAFANGSAEVPGRLAVGYLTVRAQHRDQDVLLGDYFLVDESEDFAQGEAMVDVDRTRACGSGLCRRHALRFLDGGAFDGGTELIVWTASRRQPGAQLPRPGKGASSLRASAFEEPGVPLGERDMDVLPLQVVRVSDLAFGQPFGWLDLVTEEDSYVAVRYTAGHRFSALFAASCLPLEIPSGPRLGLEKSTNGADADQAPGVQLAVGDPVVWEYVVTNTGSVPLADVRVDDDDPALTVSCPGTSLAPGEQMTCTAEGVAGQCGYRNLGTAVATGADGGAVLAEDASHYFASLPAALELELKVNGEEADSAPGIHVDQGAPLVWAYEVTNPGEARLEEVVVTDAQGEPVECPRAALGPGESMTCRVHEHAGEEGGFGRGTVTGRSACGTAVEAADEAWYRCGSVCTEDAPAISLEKATNGHDADSGPGPQIAPGSPVTWTYVVTNTGATALHDVVVTDDDPALGVVCPGDALDVGQAMTCTAVGVAGEGEYANLGSVQAVSRCGVPVSDGDSSHYHNTPTPPPPPPGDEGCTPGYWKNHTDSWAATGWSPSASVASVFAAASAYPAHGSASLLEALSFQGGPGVEGAVGNLLRAAVAGLLDASHGGVGYPRTAGDLVADVDAALASGDRATMLALAAGIDADNNLGCPLN